MPQVEDATHTLPWDWSGAFLVHDGDIVLPFQVQPLEIQNDEDALVRGFDLLFTFSGRPPTKVAVPAFVLGATRPCDTISAAGGPNLTLKESQVIVSMLTDVRSMPETFSVVEKDVITRAEWIDNTLHAPGLGLVADWKPELAAYGQCANISEDEAYVHWKRVIEHARGSAKAMTVIGMPFGSIFNSVLSADTFALHITAESSLGKTESAEIAMSALSSARRPHGALYRTWDASAQAPTNLLKLAGPLPVWFDETAVLGGDDDMFTNLLFRLAQGRGRLVADTEGGLRGGSGERWDSSIISTGEARVSNKSGLTGLRRRVIEVYAPLTNRDDHDIMLSAARAAHGWPLRWLVQESTIAYEHMSRVYNELFGMLAQEARAQQTEVAMASNLAICLAGFASIAKLCNMHITMAELVVAGTKMFGKLQSAAEEEGSDVGERALRAVKEAMQQRPLNFPKANEELLGYTRWGCTFDDGYVGIVGKSTLKSILREFADIRDVQPVLEKWVDMNVLQHDSGKYTGRRQIFVQGAGMKTSVLVLVKVR